MLDSTAAEGRSTGVPHRVFIVEDDPHIRERLGAAVALVDLGLPDDDGAELISELAAQPEAPRVLVISVFGDERRVIHAIEAGADGYLLKDSGDTEIGAAVLSVVTGDSPISPAIARHLLRRFQPATQSSGARATEPSPITPRETEVLTLIARGYSNAEVAGPLGMSANTVTSHTKSIYRTLAVSSRSEAVLEAAQLGLISLAGRSSNPDSR